MTVCRSREHRSSVPSVGAYTATRRMVANLAAVALLAGCGASIEAGIEGANDLLFKKQYVAAEALYYKLLKRLGENSDLSEQQDQQRLIILDRLGKVNSLYLHDYTRAIGFYAKLVKLYPQTEQAFAARSMVADIYQHRLGNLEAAVSEYQRLVVEFPDRDETRRAQLRIAQAFFTMRNFDQARTEAEALIKRWPGSAEAAQARFQIANSFYAQGRYTEAITAYERLLEGQPEASLASLVMFELGNCFQELDDADRSLSYYYASLANHPNPLLVQRKIKHVRTRIHRTRPAATIELPPYAGRPLAVAKQSGSASDRPAAGNLGEMGVVSERNVFKESTIERTESTLTTVPASHQSTMSPALKPEARHKADGDASVAPLSGAAGGAASATPPAPAP